jgi:hypothetical protein
MASRATDEPKASVGGRKESCAFMSFCFTSWSSPDYRLPSPQHDEKKKLDQLKKEIEEERQLAELQRLQEETTGKKRVEKVDWMYATPSTAEAGGALGGQRIGEKDMEQYLLGKKRVDEVLKQGDNVSNLPHNALIPANRTPSRRSVLLTSSSSPSKMPTLRKISLRKSERIPYSRSRDKSNWPTNQ